MASEAQTRSRALPAAAVLYSPPASRLAALLLVAGLSLAWTWWALADGAFFGTVMLPGSILIFALLAVAIGLARLPIAPRGPHAIAAVALLALAVWAALSAFWSPAPDLAIEVGQRTLLYAATFVAGLAAAIALRRHLTLMVVPLLVAGGICAVVVLVTIWQASDAGGLVDGEGTLDFPFGYRNANGGFFVMVGLCAVAMVARRSTGYPGRAALGALSSAAFALAAISQSRGSLIAALAGAAILVLSTPDRGRALVALVVTLLPVVLTFPELLAPFHAAADAAPILPGLQDAARAAVIATALGGLLTAGSVVLERHTVGERSIQIPLRAILIGIAAVFAVGIIAAIAVKGSPSHWLDATSASTGTTGEATGSRFTYGGNLNRTDFWRVAIDQAEDHPIAGGGAGSFRSAYLLARDTGEQPRDAHSLPLEFLTELGLVGLALLVVAFAAALLGTLRSRRLGPESAYLASAALTVATVWGAQAMVDWSWSFPALTAPAIGMLGAASAPAALALRPLPRSVAAPAVAVLVVGSLLAVPTFVADRLTFDAATGWQGDPAGAYSALDNAADLNPYTAEPLLIEAEIARRSDEPDRALAALARAEARTPEDWRIWLLRAEILERSDPVAAREAADRALELNPRSRQAGRIAGGESAAPGAKSSSSG